MGRSIRPDSTSRDAASLEQRVANLELMLPSVNNLASSQGTGAADLGSNCPAMAPVAPVCWVTVHTDLGEAYVPVWQ